MTMAKETNVGLNCLEAGDKLARLKQLALELRREIPANMKQLKRVEEISLELNEEIIKLDVQVAPKLIGKEAALLPVMY
jgi:hypothetical protein